MPTNYAKTLIVALAVVVLVMAIGLVGFGPAGADGPTTDTAPLAQADTENESSIEQTIAIDATGTASAAPDQATVRITVSETGNQTDAVRDQLAAGSTALESALDELGVEYRTIRYEIEEPPRHVDRELPPVAGTHVYKVVVEDTTRTGTVVDAGADAGAEVTDLTLTLSDTAREELRNEAVVDAMTDAEEQATALAGTNGLTVGEPVSIDATQGRYSPVEQLSGAFDGGDSETDISTGDVSVTYSVEVVYEAASED
ncbi:MAG: hypothetical protein J07HX5_00612 [halophilic archaeon J07HX5]|jgi:Uncharacterized conserved protein|nr:MAG: hypothetical protein J07HX5_00612 [halophilic archaeon J07HX5]